MNASKEFRLRQAARLSESKQSMQRSWRDLDASLARYRAVNPKAGFLASRFVSAQPKFTKLWFALLEWVLIMGALRYLYSKTESSIVLVVFWVSLVLFALYVPFAVGRLFQFFRFPFVKSLALTIVLSMCISAVSGFGVLYLLQSLVYEVATHDE